MAPTVPTQAPHRYWRLRQVAATIRWAIVELKINGVKPAGGSCTSSPRLNPCGKAIDGDRTIGSHWDSNADGESWWQYNFAPPGIWLSSIEMVNYWTSNAHQAPHFMVEWLDDDSTWVQAYSATVAAGSGSFVSAALTQVR